MSDKTISPAMYNVRSEKEATFFRHLEIMETILSTKRVITFEPEGWQKIHFILNCIKQIALEEINLESNIEFDASIAKITHSMPAGLSVSNREILDIFQSLCSDPERFLELRRQFGQHTD